MERDQFVSRVRSSLRGAALPDLAGPLTAPSITFDEPVARFVTSATAVAAEVVRVPSSEGATDEVVRLAGADQHTGSYIAWEDIDHLVPDLSDRMATAGWRYLDAVVGADSRSDDHERIALATVGVTGVDVAVAATGSLVLAHGPGRSRSASLLVEHHIAVLSTSSVVASLDEAFRKVEWSRTSNVAAITGPSRTGDIESILTLGVHGPRRLSIVLIG